MEVVWIGMILIVAAVIAGAIFLHRRLQSVHRDAQPEGVVEEEEPPQRLLIGEHQNHPIITIESSKAHADYKKGRSIDLSGGSIGGRLSALLQAAPSILVAAQSSGKRLMEVTINGDLTRAADGNGLRAFALGAKGITEHARIFEVKNLQNMINAAAVWQIASVVVAQKHLADISQKLEEIKTSITGISKFLDNQRKARIKSTYGYLIQVSEAIQAGELSTGVRGALESCERDLLEIHQHLIDEFRQLVDDEIKHSEMVGTEDLTRGISEKINQMNEIASDLQMCLRTRIGAWHILSVFPGEPRLTQARRASIQASADEMQRLGPFLHTALGAEIDGMKSIWNTRATLEARKSNLRASCHDSRESLLSKASEMVASLARTSQQFVKHDQPTRILIEVKSGVLVAARQVV